MEEKTSIGKELSEKLSYKNKNFYETASPEEIKAAYEYCEGYKKFLDEAKTEREATLVAVEMAKKAGYEPCKTCKPPQ